MAFTQKLINVVFDLANGNFAGGGNTATVSGLRVSAHIVNTGGATQGQAACAIFGMPLSLMNQLTNVGNAYQKDFQNQITIYAGDAETSLHVVFKGIINSASVNAQAQPQVAFVVDASTGTFHRVTPAKPISIKGGADVASLMQGLAGQMGYGFENAGVTVKLANAYYSGSLWSQAYEIAQDAGIAWGVDRGTMVIVPPGKARSGEVPLIAASGGDIGMVGYPLFNANHVIVSALYDSRVTYLGKVQIKSDLTAANGQWTVNSLEYNLESMVPNGKWFMTLDCNNPNSDTPA